MSVLPGISTPYTVKERLCTGSPCFLQRRIQALRTGVMYIFVCQWAAFGVLTLVTACHPKQGNEEQVADSQPEKQEQMAHRPVDSVKHILILGNSLTAGYGIGEEQAFPHLLQKRIDSLGLDYTVINAGVSGETTAGGLARIDWVLQQPVDIFVLALGANDALRGFDLESTRSNLRAIIDKVRELKPGARIIIAGMMAPPNMGPEYTAEFNSIFPDLAENYEAALVPFLLEDVAANPELNQEDGIHPNVRGHQVVMENVWRVLKGHL